MDNVERIANDFLREEQVADLPVDIEYICQCMGYSVVPYSAALGVIQICGLEQDTANHDGLTVHQGTKYIILYRDNLVPDQRRQVVAHELGHILLHYESHIMDYADPRLGREMLDKLDAEADRFARLILAPVALLDEYGADTVSDIEYLTGFDPITAKSICNDLHLYRRRLQRINFKGVSGKRRKITLANHLQPKKSKAEILVPLLCMLISVVVLTSVVISIIGSKANAKNPAYTESKGLSNTYENSTEPPVSMYDLPSSTPVGDVVYVTRSGDKYHHAGCQYIKGKDNLVEMTEAEAIAAGYEPCLVCCE